MIVSPPFDLVRQAEKDSAPGGKGQCTRVVASRSGYCPLSVGGREKDKYIAAGRQAVLRVFWACLPAFSRNPPRARKIPDRTLAAERAEAHNRLQPCQPKTTPPSCTPPKTKVWHPFPFRASTAAGAVLRSQFDAPRIGISRARRACADVTSPLPSKIIQLWPRKPQ